MSGTLYASSTKLQDTPHAILFWRQGDSYCKISLELCSDLSTTSWSSGFVKSRCVWMWSLESLSKIQFSSSCLLLSQNTLLRDGQGSHEMQIMVLDLTLGQEHWECGTTAWKAQLCHVLFVVGVHLVHRVRCILLNLTTPSQQEMLHLHFQTVFLFLSPHSSLVSQKNLWTGQVPPFGHQVWPWLGSGSPGELVCVGTASRWSPEPSLRRRELENTH